MKILKRLKYFVFNVLLCTLISTRVSYHLDIRPLEILTLTASRVLKLIDVLMHHIHLYASLIKKKELLFRQLDNWNLFYSRYSTEVLICAKGFYRFASGTVNLSPWSVSSDTTYEYYGSGNGKFFFSKVGRGADKNEHHEIKCTQFKENYILWFSLNHVSHELPNCF